MNETLTTASAAKVIGKSPHWLYVNSERLKIPRYRIGGRWVYLESELAEWFMAQKEMHETSSSHRSKSRIPNQMRVEFS
jgi:hypothetical protein